MSYNDLLEKIPTSLFPSGSDLHKLLQIFFEGLDEIDGRLLQVKNLRDIDSLSGINLTKTGSLIRARCRELNESDGSYKTVIDLENRRTSASGSIPDILKSLSLISNNLAQYQIHEGFKFGLPGVLRVVLTGGTNGFAPDDKYLYAIENHAATGMRYSILNEFSLLGATMILKTIISQNGWDNTSLLDNLQVFHVQKNWLNIQDIAVGNGAEPGGILREAQQNDTGLQNELIRVSVSAIVNTDTGRSYLATISPQFGGINVNEVAGFNNTGDLVAIKSFPSLPLSDQINNDFMISEDYHA